MSQSDEADAIKGYGGGVLADEEASGEEARRREWRE